MFQAEAEMLRNAQKRTAVEWDYETDMSERNEEQKRKYEVSETAVDWIDGDIVHIFDHSTQSFSMGTV